MMKIRIPSISLICSFFLTLIPTLVMADQPFIIPIKTSPNHINSSFASLQISGNSVIKYSADDPITISPNSTAGARIAPSTSAGHYYVTFPVTYYYRLFGSTAKLEELGFFYKTSSAATHISTILVRRQRGVCTASDCYDSLLFSTADRTCSISTGCYQTEFLDDSSYDTFNYGSVYITLQLYFSSDSSWIEIGGLRLFMQYIPD